MLPTNVKIYRKAAKDAKLRKVTQRNKGYQ